MGIFEQLRPFVFFCQLCGFTPFRMLFHPQTKQFQRFIFYWLHPLTWWFIFQFVIYFAVPAVEIFILYDSLSDASRVNEDLPEVMHVISVAVMAFHALSFLLCRYISLYFSAFRRALERIKRIDSILIELPDDCKLSLRRRIIAGLVFITIGVAATTYGLRNVYEGNDSSRNWSLLSIIILMILEVFTLSSFGCAFLMIHLSYYIVAYYIRLLGFNLLKTMSNERDKIAWASDSFNERGDLKTKLRNGKRLFGELCEATAALHTVFNFPVLLIIVTRLVIIIYSLFIIVYGFLKPREQYLNSIWMSTIFLFLRSFLMLLTVCHAADMPVVQVAELREKIITIITSNTLENSAEKFEAMSFLQHISEERVRLSAGGLFKVGVHLFPSLTAAVVTYLIVLLQTESQ